MLQKQLITIAPRELGGPSGGLGFQFQKDISISIIARLVINKSNFVAFFEHHDDLSIANNSDSPTQIDFYQIKSKNAGKWSTKNLTSVERKKTLSILGKLYNNLHEFHTSARKMYFISNAPFEFGLLDDGTESNVKQEIKFKDLSATTQGNITKHLSAAFGLASLNLEDRIVFQKHHLSLTDSTTHCKGIIYDACIAFHQTGKVDGALAYQQILNEVIKKSHVRITDYSSLSFDALVELKAITDKQFEQYLMIAGTQVTPNEEWLAMQSILLSQGLALVDILKLKSAWRTMQIESYRPANLTEVFLTDSINVIKGLDLNALGNPDTLSLADHVRSQVVVPVTIEKEVALCFIIRAIHEA